jgi:integrase
MAKREWPKEITVGNVTVKVYRVKHASAAAGVAYVVAFKDGNQRKLAKFADPDEALREARQKADALNAGRIEGASMTIAERDVLQAAQKLCGDVPIIAALEEWKQVREITGGNAIPAARAWAAKQGTSYKSDTVAKLVEQFLKSKKAGGVKTKKTYKPLAHLKEKFGALQMDVVSSLALGKWMQARYPNAVYFNTALSRFRTLWTWARKNGFLPKDAQTVAEAVDTAREKPNRIGIIKAETLKELLAMVRKDRPELLAPLVLAAFCGLRSSEVHGQQWDDIDLAGGHVRVTAAKANTPAFRLVPLCATAKEWLLLCPDRKDRVCRTVVDVERIRDMATAAKIEMPDNAFRHSYISHAVAATGDVNRTALDCGNSPQKIFRNYRSLVSEAEGKEWFTLTPATVASRGKLVGMDGKAVANA